MTMELFTAAKQGDLGKIKAILETETGDTKLTLLNDFDRDGKTPLHIASEEGHIDLVKYFTDGGADLEKQSKSGDTPLHLASLKGHVDVAQYLIGKGADVNELSYDGLTLSSTSYLHRFSDGWSEDEDRGHTPLCSASREGHLDVTECLVNAGADVNKASYDGHTPIYAAASKGHLDVVEYLINKGAQLKQERYGIKNPLHIAALNGRLEVVKYLISKGAGIDMAGYSDYTPLHGASKNNHLDIVKYLVNAGSDVNKLSPYGEETPLHTALHNGHLDVVKYLISQGADIDKDDYNGCPPLYYASLNGHLDVVECLVNAGADVNKLSPYGEETPLHTALHNGHLDVVKYLISQGADIDKDDYSGCPPLYYASLNGHLDVVECLVNAGADVNKIHSHQRDTPLYAASQNGHLDVVKYLISKQADISKTAQNGQTVLHVAAFYGHLDVMKYLVTNGEEINVEDGDKCTPLHAASKEGHFNVVKYLVEAGADINQSSHNGYTPISSALQKGHQDIVEFFMTREAEIGTSHDVRSAALCNASSMGNLDAVRYIVRKGVDLNCRDTDGFTPLYRASENGYLHAVEFIVKSGADVKQASYKGRLSLHAASMKGHLDVVEYLISQGSDVNGCDNDGQTPLYAASQEGYLGVVKHLVDAGGDVNKASKDGYGPLYTALLEGHQDVVHYLITREAEVGISDEFTTTAMRHAFLYGYYGHDDIIKYLIGKCEDLNRCDIDGNTPLYIASQKGLLHIVECLVNKGADINAPSTYGVTPLHATVERGHIHIVQYLISKGARLDVVDHHHSTPLYISSESGLLEIVECLVNARANINTASQNGYTPLGIALHYNRNNVAQFLMSKGADIGNRADIVNTILLNASSRGDLGTVEYITGKGVDLDVGNKDGITPLYRASQSGHLDVVECLVHAGANVNKATNNGSTPLYTASQGGHIDVVKYLITQGAKIEKSTNDGHTPLNVSSFYGYLDVVSYLISQGAKTGMSDKDGFTPIYVASYEGHLDVVECLENAGADVSKAVNNGAISLHAASHKGHLEIVKFIISKGVNLNTGTGKGFTSLYYASESGHFHIVECLVNAGADVNKAANSGSTSLYAASHKGHLNIVKYLIDRGAEVNKRGYNGQTPLRVASFYGQLQVVKYLISKGAKTDMSDQDGCTPIYVASKGGHLGVVECLVNAGADVNKAADSGSTSLYAASRNGHLNIVKHLTENGAEVDRRGYDDQTPLRIASFHGHLDVVKYLISIGADLDAGDQGGYAPLYAASQEGHRKIVECLVKAGADINKGANDGDAPIHAASRKGYFEIMKYLTVKGAQMETRNEYGWTILHYASDNGHVELLEYLLGNKTKSASGNTGSILEIGLRTSTGVTPLMLAARGGIEHCVRLLLDNKADVEAEDAEGWTALHYAAASGNSTVVKDLLGCKESMIMRVSRRGSSPLSVALSSRNADIAKYLLDKDVTCINGCDSDGLTPIHHATISGLTSIIEELVSRGADVNLQSHDGQTPLHLAIKLCHCKEREVEETPALKQIISPSELFNQHKKLFSIPIATEPDSRTQMINITISSSNGRAKTSVAFMALQTGFSTDIGSTAEEIYSGPITELSNSEEIIAAKMTTDLYYHLGIALGLSYQTLDRIQFGIRKHKGSNSLEDGGRFTPNQKAATAMIRHWGELQDSVTKANYYLREVWNSVNDSNPFMEQGRRAEKEPGGTTEDVFTESDHEEPLLTPLIHAHGLGFQISSQIGRSEGSVHGKRIRTPSDIISELISSVSTAFSLLERASRNSIYDEATSPYSAHKYMRAPLAVRPRRRRRVQRGTSIDEQHEHDEDPEEHRKRFVLAWMEATEERRPTAVRPKYPSPKPKQEYEEMTGPTHSIYSPSAEPPELTQVREIEDTEDLGEHTGVIRLKKHDIEVRILPGETYGVEDVTLLERAKEGRPAAVKPNEPSSNPGDEEEEMTSGPAYPNSPPSSEIPEQTQVQETENREVLGEDTGGIRLKKHDIEVMLPPDGANGTTDVPLMGKAEEGKTAAVRQNDPPSKPEDEEEETTSGPAHPNSPPSQEPPKQIQVQETKDTKDAGEGTGMIRLEKHGIEVRIPPNEAYSAKDVNVGVIDEVPQELVLKEKEVIISVGLKLSPSHLQFNSPVKVTMRHSAIFSNAGKADIILYTRKNETESFSAIPCKATGIPRCVVRQRDLDLYIDHFSEWWIVAYIRRVFIGKRVICTPYVPIPTIRNTEYHLYLCITDDNNGSPEERKGYDIPFQPTQYYVKWRRGDLTISYFHGTTLIDTKKITEEKLYYLTSQQVAFPLNTKGNIEDRLFITYRLMQSIEENIEFHIDIKDSHSETMRQASTSGGDRHVTIGRTTSSVTGIDDVFESPGTETAAGESGASCAEGQTPEEEKLVSDADILKLSKLLTPNLFYELHVALGIDYSIAEGIREKTKDVDIQYIHLLQKWKAKSPYIRADLDAILQQAGAGGHAKKYYNSNR